MLPRCKSILIVSAALLLFSSSIILADGITSNVRDISQGSWPDVVAELREKPVGKRIVYWAGKFIGTPYDTDPLGKYVREERIVADDAVDCMYLTFRAVELALSKTEKEAIGNALNLRFHGKGKMDGERVVNYDDRFQYGEDMIDSGKWGKEMTSQIGRTEKIKGSRGRKEVTVIPKDELLIITDLDIGEISTPFKEGDIMFFVKSPEKRVVGEIVGHMGIISVKAGVPFLIHAGGTKKSSSSEGGGKVKSLLLSEYVEKMGFVGVRVTRFQ